MLCSKCPHRTSITTELMNNWSNNKCEEKKFQHRIILGNVSHFTCHDPIITPIFSFVGQLLYNYIRYYGSAWIIYTIWAHTPHTALSLSLSLSSIVTIAAISHSHFAFERCLEVCAYHVAAIKDCRNIVLNR